MSTEASVARLTGGEPLAGTVKEVADAWTWMSDYVYLWADWTLNCPPDRTCQVGMGVKVGNSDPLGEKIRFSGTYELTTVGLGAIHVRTVDGKGPSKVRLDEGKVGLVPIINGTFP